MKNLVILSGAGISAESGIKTFRDADGLWEGHDIMEV
ncbi:NAD-dependent protein deacylase, partial [Salmonella enterica subsp. enterica serovar Enteritidis]